MIDHVVANNLRSAAEFTIIRGAIEKHESVFKSFGGHDMGRLSTDLQDMDKMVTDLNTQVSERDNQISVL